MAQKRIRRFYGHAGVRAAESGDGGLAEEGGGAPRFEVLLDERPLRSPGGRRIYMPCEELARELADEFGRQRKYIDPADMPLLRLANMTADAVLPDPGPAREEIAGYASCDLLCYRAAAPLELAARQAGAWDVILEKFAGRAGARFAATSELAHVRQEEEALQYVRGELAGLEGFALAALLSITGLTGSALLALALRHGWLGADEAWRAAHIDEDYQMELWGEDEEAMASRQYRRREYDAAIKALRCALLL
jgi:chaperone required for assembly of F1-ATPase